MVREIACPHCAEAENLRGTATPEGVKITCESCGMEWMRDSVPQVCKTCGGTDVIDRTRALTQYSRGTQLSIVGLGAIWLCRNCDAEMVEWCDSGRPVPFEYNASATDAEAGAEREGGGPEGTVSITP